MQILEMFLISLALTLVIETAVALLFGVRMPGLKVVWLVNLLTNPPAVCANWLLGMWFPAVSFLGRGQGMRFPAVSFPLWQLPIEVVVILVEAGVYRCFASDMKWGIRKPVALAVIANLVSYCIGLLVI